MPEKSRDQYRAYRRIHFSCHLTFYNGAHGSSECQALRLMRFAAAFLPNHQFNWKTQNRTLTKTHKQNVDVVLLIPFPFQSPSGVRV